jgi:Glycosyl transferase family 2
MLSVIVPTVGRPTLGRTLRSVIPQLASSDELIVIADGPEAHEAASGIVGRLNGRCRLYATDTRTGSWGNAQRDLGMTLATRTHLTFMDDDDVYAPGAFAAIRKAVTVDSDAVHIFGMRAWNGDVLPSTREVLSGNVGTPMVVIPNVKERLGSWVHPELLDQGRSDFAFISETISKHPRLVWHDEVIALCRPTTPLLVAVGSPAARRSDVLVAKFPRVAGIYRLARKPIRLLRR